MPPPAHHLAAITAAVYALLGPNAHIRSIQPAGPARPPRWSTRGDQSRSAVRRPPQRAGTRRR